MNNATELDFILEEYLLTIDEPYFEMIELKGINPVPIFLSWN